MHEFSIALSIADIAIESAIKSGVDHIASVEVEVGQVSGVVTEALQFAWESAIKNTIAADAVLIVRTTILRVKCNACGNPYEPDDLYETCPFCGEITPEILSGKELRVMAIVT